MGIALSDSQEAKGKVNSLCNGGSLWSERHPLFDAVSTFVKHFRVFLKWRRVYFDLILGRDIADNSFFSASYQVRTLTNAWLVDVNTFSPTAQGQTKWWFNAMWSKRRHLHIEQSERVHLGSCEYYSIMLEIIWSNRLILSVDFSKKEDICASQFWRCGAHNGCSSVP